MLALVPLVLRAVRGVSAGDVAAAGELARRNRQNQRYYADNQVTITAVIRRKRKEKALARKQLAEKAKEEK